jgi:uncharacterized phage protein gp47/JayE
MAYFPPVITAAGLSVPQFSDIQESLLTSYQSIYGTSTYLGNDSADYQWISAVALKLNDSMNLCQLAYNARSPLTAIGADLDSVVKLNGIVRLSSSYSTVVLTLTGISGTIITNGVVSDVNGILWSLPTSVTIGSGGTVSATAICQQIGSISADIDSVNNPVGGYTAGWTAVTNPGPAVVGTPVESDSNLRGRQSISVALPSSTRLAGTQADIEALPGVTRVNILENQTSVTDSYGNESHSLTCVVEGGTDLAIATAIYDNKGIGANTQGATVPTMTIVPVTDANSNSGNVTDIGFVRPVYIPIYVSLSVHGLTAGFTTATQTAIVAAIVTYLNALSIGEEINQSSLYGAALSVMPNPLQPIFSIRALTLGITSSPTGTTDIALLFFQVAEGITANVVLTVV